MAAQNPMYSIASGVANGTYGHNVIYCLQDDHFYIYYDGYWKECFEIELLSDICKTQLAKEANIDYYPHATKKQILDSLKLLVYKPLSDFNTNGFLNFPSGLLDVTGNNFLPHNPEIITTIRLPYKYDLIAECPLWEKTLLEIFDNNESKVRILQEYFGYCLTRDTRKEKALLLLGESRTGKSTILHVLRHLIGVKNVSSVPLKFISNPQYTPMLINKMVNIDADVSGNAQEFEAEFKIITSGEPVSCNQKFVATFEFTPYCKMVMAANEFPRITDHSSAFYKRLILIPCDKVFEESEQNINLKDDLLKELSGILNWSMRGLIRLNARGRFEHNKFMTDAIKDLREESNPTEVFFNEFVEINVKEEAEIDKGELYASYVSWCKENTLYILSSVKFSQAVYRKYSKYTPKKTMNHKTGKRVWKNIRLINYNQSKGEEISWQDR